MVNDKFIGRLLDNRYEILEVIGIGGMAVVYKARCHRLNRLVAIKILKDEFSKDEDFRRRFHAEGQAVAMVSHPNIVAVYDVSSSGEADYIVMELIDGISLKQYMEKKGVLNWKETLHFGIQISKALEHAHSRGIVHRDIKPHNVMVLKNGSVKVADFGIARVMSQGNTLTKEALGSVHYISPEQAKGGRVDDRSDIYSLGTVMYEMMTGRPPYDGESPVAVAIQHINGGARMPSTINPNIPGGMEQIIMKAMAHDPADRYASATAMLYDMDEFRKNPTILFDYHTPPTDAVIRLHPNSDGVASPRSTAQRVAAAGSGMPRRRPSTAMSSAEQRSEARRAQRNTAASRRSEPPRRRRNDYEEEEDRGKAATIAIIACSAVAIIAIIVFLVALFGGGTSSNDSLVSVPTLIGKNYDSLITSDDFVILPPQYEHNDEYEKGRVINQEPAPGQRVGKGTQIHIVVSLGKEPKVKTMEDLVNQERTIAENYLTGQGVLFLCTEEYHDTVKEGYVIRTDPEAGTTLEDGQTVMLYISLGPKTKTAPMPKVEGQTVETARTIINNQKMDLQIKELEENSDTVPEGRVIRSDPAAGEELKTGDTVTLYVSKGPETAKMPNVEGESLETALKMLDSAGFKNVVYEEYVESDQPKDTVVEQSVEAGEEVPVTTQIVLKLSAGPIEETQPETQPEEVTKLVRFGLMEDMLEAYLVKIVRVDTGEVVFEAMISNTKTEIEIELTGSGKVVYEVFQGEGHSYKQEVDFSAP